MRRIALWLSCSLGLGKTRAGEVVVGEAAIQFFGEALFDLDVVVDRNRSSPPAMSILLKFDLSLRLRGDACGDRGKVFTDACGDRTLAVPLLPRATMPACDDVN